MDTKGDVEEITYPFLSFMVDNFDEVSFIVQIRGHALDHKCDVLILGL
jgi:hypothetical protein